MSSSWERIASRSGGTVAGLAQVTSSTGETVVFAATPVGVYRSTDGGRSWTLPGIKPTVPFADIVVASPRFAQDHTIFVCGADGLYRSSDAGDTWQRILVGSRMLGVVVSTGEAVDRLVVLVGTESDGILRSEDSGRTWTGANAGLLDLTVLCLALSPCFDADRTGFAGTASGLYRTRNGGRSWRSVDAGLDEPAVQCLAVSPNFANDHLVLAGTEADGVLRSTDGGTTWHRPPSLAGLGVAALAFSPGFPASPMIAATQAGLALSEDGEETWQTLETAPDAPILSLVFVGDELLAGLHREGIVRSADGGSTWQPANDGLSARLDTELVLSPNFANDRTLFVGGIEDGVRVSTDGGSTWEGRLDGLQDAAVSSLAVSATYASDQIVYAATSRGLQVSRDGTLTWHAESSIDGAAGAVAAGPGRALAALEGGRLFATEDARLWRTLRAPFDGREIIALAVSPAYERDQTLFVATADATEVVLWRSVDGGSQWQRWLVVPVGGLGRMPLALAASYRIDESVFVGLGGRVLKPLRTAQEVRSGERRPVWRAAQLGRDTVGVTALAVSPNFAQDRTVFAAGNAGVFVSRDGGESFSRWNEGLDPARIVSVAVSPNYQIDRLVYALGLGGTIWRRRDA